MLNTRQPLPLNLLGALNSQPCFWQVAARCIISSSVTQRTHHMTDTQSHDYVSVCMHKRLNEQTNKRTTKRGADEAVEQVAE
jgi:hypothetical protein